MRPTQPPVQSGAFLRGKTQLGRDADHSTPSSVEVNGTSYISSLPWCLHGIAGQLFMIGYVDALAMSGKRNGVQVYVTQKHSLAVTFTVLHVACI
jgi:hypothetical protein